jgi:glutamate/tyrosine decarboxylase-like PLP-dependent enzyme
VGPPRIYASKESHLAWFKIAHQTGIGRDAVQLVPTDGAGRMDAAALQAAVERDRAAGCLPVMVAATAGTTNAGMIDPLVQIRQIARDNGLWYHVDAAWGGAICASLKLGEIMAGIEIADSITLDAHKWLAVPMGAGVILCRDQGLLGRTFGIETSYMPEGVAGLDPYANSAQWSRRFMGFKLFLSLAVVGRDGYAAMIGRSVDLAKRLQDILAASGWTVVNDPSLAVVCFVDEHSGVDPAVVAKRVVERGEAWISVARFEGRPVLRACITSHRTTEADLERLVEALNAARV